VRSDRALVAEHLDALLGRADAAGIPRDVVGRLLLEKAIALWREARSAEDVAAELRFAIEHLGGDEDFPFMRP